MCVWSLPATSAMAVTRPGCAHFSSALGCALREHAPQLPRRIACARCDINFVGHHGAGKMTCVQVAGLGTPDSPTPEIGLAKGALPGNPCFFKCIQVSDCRRQLMQTSNTGALPRSLRAGDLGYPRYVALLMCSGCFLAPCSLPVKYPSLADRFTKSCSSMTVLSAARFILMVASTCRDAQAASFWGPATFGDHWGLSTLGRKGVADGAPIGTSAAGGLRPNARSLAESECYEIMSPRVQQVGFPHCSGNAGPTLSVTRLRLPKVPCSLARSLSKARTQGCPAGGHDVPHHRHNLSGEHLDRLAAAHFSDGAPRHRVRRPSEEVLHRACVDEASKERL